MKVLAVITNILLGISIILSSFAFVAGNATKLDYLNETAKESNIYAGAAKAATKLFLRQATQEADPAQKEATRQLANLIDKDYVTKKSESLLSQFEDFSEGKISKVKLDLSDLVKKAKAQGASLKDTNVKPIVLLRAEDSGIDVFQASNFAKTSTIVTYVITSLLGVVALVLAFVRKRFLGLSITLLVSGILISFSAIFGTLFNLAIVKNINVPEDVAPLNPYVQEFARLVVGDMARQYLIISLSLITIAIAGFVATKKLAPKANVDGAKPTKK